MGKLGRDRILTLQSDLEEDGIQVSLRKLCRVLGNNRSQIYYKTTVRKKRRTEKWLEEAIRKVIEQYPEYGKRRITVLIRREYGEINHKRIHRIIKLQGWQRWKRSYGKRPRVQGMKSVTPQVNSRWAIDMTHIHVRETGWCHLVGVIDCCDRYLVGWRFSQSGKAGICAGALEDALIREKLFSGKQGLVIRSDNGLVFSSKRFHETITKNKLYQEYITPYTPEQNGMIERFFRSFKEECAWQQEFKTFDEAYDKIAGWIDYYNQQRPHSALGYIAPADLRKQLVA